MEIVEWWDRALGVFFALDIPWMIHWELYCNEPNPARNRIVARARSGKTAASG
jgi:hypothetical protein